jgi:hypothetical protein
MNCIAFEEKQNDLHSAVRLVREDIGDKGKLKGKQ